MSEEDEVGTGSSRGEEIMEPDEEKNLGRGDMRRVVSTPDVLNPRKTTDLSGRNQRFFIPYPAPGNFCWSPTGHLTIVENPRFSILKYSFRQTENKKFYSEKDITHFYNSLKKNNKAEEAIYPSPNKGYILNDNPEDEEFHMSFDTEALQFEDEDDEAEKVDYLNFKVSENENSHKEDANEKKDEKDLVITLQEKATEEYEYFDMKDNPELKNKFSKLIKLSTPVRKRVNLELEISNRISVYDFSGYALMWENGLLNFMRKFGIISYESLQTDFIYNNMILEVAQPNKYLSNLLKWFFDDEKIGDSFDNKKFRYFKIMQAMDDYNSTLCFYLRNYFEQKLKEAEMEWYNLNLENLVLALCLESFINFTKLRGKTLEVVHYIQSNFPKLFNENTLFEKIFNLSHINSMQLFENAFDDFEVFIKKLSKSPDLLKTKVIPLRASLTGAAANRRSLDELPLKIKSSGKNFMEDPETSIKYISARAKMPNKVKFSMYEMKFLSNIKEFMILTEDQKTWLTQVVKESIYNMRRRALFEQSSTVNKLLSLSSLTRTHINSLNNFIDYYNKFVIDYHKNNEKIYLNIESDEPSQKPESLTCCHCDMKVTGLALICKKCKHGGHFAHIKSRFEKSKFCPKCDCRCFSS